jgi:hypothetical protein
MLPEGLLEREVELTRKKYVFMYCHRIELIHEEMITKRISDHLNLAIFKGIDAPNHVQQNMQSSCTHCSLPNNTPDR